MALRMALYPLIFRSISKERVWGGRRLGQLYGKDLPPYVPVGESWEISDRPSDVSVIDNGRLTGKNLRWLIEHHRTELMGNAALYNGHFPLLIKILDAREKLSLQVHPPAGKAIDLSGDPKTELWYVAEAAPDAELYVGLRKGCTRQEFAARIHDGTVADCFHRVRVRAGDVMFLPSGRVHALGAGMVIFEIQQNSDTTYRVFDWNRMGLDGKPRQLHVDESLESIRFDDFEPDLVRPEPVPGQVSRALLVNDPVFNVELAEFEPGQGHELVEGEMQIIGVVSGEVAVQSAGENLGLSAGRFCLIPASLDGVALSATGPAKCLFVKAGHLPAL